MEEFTIGLPKAVFTHRDLMELRDLVDEFQAMELPKYRERIEGVVREPARLEHIDIAAQNAILRAMKPVSDINALPIPPALLAKVEAAAHAENRPSSDVVRDALEHYLMGWHRSASFARAGHKPGKPTPAEAVDRILEERKDTLLPDGVTIRDLLTYDRA